MSLSTSVAPQKICSNEVNTCSASTGTARVTLTASATESPKPYWPNVQVAFVIETTAYDGVYYHYFGYPGTDPCARGTSDGLPCEESNGVPFFIANAGSISAAIQANNPHSKVSFAMVDYFGTNCGDWNDCGDSDQYHVDLPTFVSASEFGGAVKQTFQDGEFGGGFIGIVGLDDNFLHSPMITAMYGAVIGSALDWSANTHHVIVLMDSTAPRDPSYDENYYVSPFDPCCSGFQALGWTCEPSYTFAIGASPNCEGWVNSQDGNPNDSIAGLTRTSPTCTDSIGHTCTVDIINYWTTTTDPNSEGWPLHPAYSSGTQNGPGAPRVQENTNHVLEAGCALAAATGGTWDGPSYWSCPNGVTGGLEYVPHGSYDHPNTNNPTLFAALRSIGFGPVYSTLVANSTGQPLFKYVPIGNIRVAPNPQFAASCQTPNGFIAACPRAPTNVSDGAPGTIGWNWSNTPSENALYVGDVWTASFNIVAVGPPYFTIVPVDACVTSDCRAAGSGSVSGEYTAATYRLAGNSSVDNQTIIQSFPVATLVVETSPATALPVTEPPPPPPTPPGIPVGLGTPLPVGNPVPVVNSVGVANVSLQATAAGFLGAGFIRVATKNRPIANVNIRAGASKSFRSKFDGGPDTQGRSSVGRFV
ncbi:MAG: hypothetical protein L3K08_06395 [Thermoplasmata archaeon]|nr:hypothetical protein [Thermoplasmata archaeon]